MLGAGVNKRATASIRELCSLGLTAELLIPSLLEALHRVIPSARNLFDWVSRAGRIERYYFEGPIDHRVARLYFDEFHNKREGEAMPRFADVVNGPASIRSAEELNRRDFFESALYHEIWYPQRLHFRLEGIVRRGDCTPIGSLVLYRERGERIFDPAEETTLQALLPTIARGLDRGHPHSADWVPEDAPAAMVNLDATGRIVCLSRDAHKMLLLAHGEITPASAARPPAAEDFATLTLLHRQLNRPGSGTEAACCITNEWGRFDFRASRLEVIGNSTAGGPCLIGVSVSHQVPRLARELAQIESLPISVTQKRVCALLLQGLSQPEIAERLSVAPSTVIDHLRKVYQKLGAHSAEELRERIGQASAARR